MPATGSYYDKIMMKSNDLSLIQAIYVEKTTHTDDLDLKNQITRSLRKPFDFKSKEDEDELKDWCQKHYKERNSEMRFSSSKIE